MNLQPNKTILLVDDDPITNLISSKVIETNSDFKVVGAMNACEALEKLRKCSTTSNQFPEVILLDINMPVMDGWEFLNEFQKLSGSKECKVFMLSSSIDPLDVQKAKTYNCVHDFISKPLTPEKLEVLNATVSYLVQQTKFNPCR